MDVIKMFAQRDELTLAMGIISGRLTLENMSHDQIAMLRKTFPVLPSTQQLQEWAERSVAAKIFRG